MLVLPGSTHINYNFVHFYQNSKLVNIHIFDGSQKAWLAGRSEIQKSCTELRVCQHNCMVWQWK